MKYSFDHWYKKPKIFQQFTNYIKVYFKLLRETDNSEVEVASKFYWIQQLHYKGNIFYPFFMCEIYKICIYIEITFFFIWKNKEN